jgi:hypothetical protein
MVFPRGVRRTGVAAMCAGVVWTAAILAGCGGGTSTNPAPPAPSISVAVTPGSAMVQASQGASFTATVSNDSKNKGTAWALSGAGCTGAACGTLSGTTAASGAVVMYTAPAAVPNPPMVTLTATAVDDATKSAKATITLMAAPPPPPAVSVTPGTINLATGGVTQSFTANVTNDSQNLGVTWSVSGTNCSGAACGSVSPATSASGAAVTYISAARARTAGTVTLTAASVADSAAVGTAVVTLAAPAAPTVSASKSIGVADVENGFGVPAIAVDATGNIDEAWINPDGVHFTRSTDGGATFSAPVLIPSDLSQNARNNLLKLVVDPAGNINLLWYRVLDSLDTMVGYNISRSTDNGATFTSPLQFTGGSQPEAGGNIPIIVGRPDGTLIVTWIDPSSNVLAGFTADGLGLSTPTTIAAAVPGAIGEKAVVGPGGQIYLFWETAASVSNCSILFSSSTDGITYSPAKAVSGGAVACNSQPAASVDAAGNLDVTWIANATSMVFVRSTDGGATFSTPVGIATPPNPTADEVFAGPDGGIYVLWTAGGIAEVSNSQASGTSFSATPTALGITIAGGPPSLTADSCGNVTVIGATSGTKTSYQRSIDGGLSFAAPVDMSMSLPDFEQQFAADKFGNVNFTWAVDGPPQIDFARLPTVCNVQ